MNNTVLEMLDLIEESLSDDGAFLDRLTPDAELARELLAIDPEEDMKHPAAQAWLKRQLENLQDLGQSMQEYLEEEGEEEDDLF
jgi:hypothetical protein